MEFTAFQIAFCMGRQLYSGVYDIFNDDEKKTSLYAIWIRMHTGLRTYSTVSELRMVKRHSAAAESAELDSDEQGAWSHK